MPRKSAQSYIANTVATQVGSLAVKFLKDKESLQGLQNFINSYLAEPYVHQDLSNARIELIRDTHIESGDEWKKLLTADVQQKWPYIWFIIRAWNGGDSEGVICGHLDTFDELRALQMEHKIPDVGVIVDSGFGSKREAEVYRHCASYSTITSRGACVGWIPSKGMPTRKRWRDPATKLWIPYYMRPLDPFLGTTEAGRMEISLFEFASMYYEDILSTLRNPKAGHGYKWTVSPQMDGAQFKDGTSYWKHMDGHVVTRTLNKISGLVTENWTKRSGNWPDHLLDCENLQVAGSHFFQWWSIEQPKQKEAA